MKRRIFLATSAGAVLSVLSRPVAAVAQSSVLTTLVNEYAAGGVVREGRVKFDIARLVDNGNSVPIEVTVDSPMTRQQHVVGIKIFNEKNPQNDVAQFTLSPQSGRARVATRIRLAATQQLVAVAKMNDGSCWTHTVEVLVTIASCVEE
ncbi:MAG: SoxY-related AACIE arm protein [Rhizobacter sp.]|nr:SoxY-related AACIE arm protein [Burkholderiales bacterium]